jgi:hypothetical protein
MTPKGEAYHTLRRREFKHMLTPFCHQRRVLGREDVSAQLAEVDQSGVGTTQPAS